jgi:hypothetical protein
MCGRKNPSYNMWKKSNAKKKCKRNNYAEETKICSYVLNIKVAYKRVEKFL